ncbi:MAG: hypothetical protein RL684_1095 [Pseudomonadota bacterium]|jgi:uncharacterized protein (DUF1697 family)
MPTWIALLRAVNVGGTGKLPMPRLKALCEQAGCTQVRTYIASGNVVLQSRLGAASLQARLAAALQVEMGKPVGLLLRTADELRAVLAAQPFADREPARCVVIFLAAPPPADAIATARGRAGEEIVAGKRELYVYYPTGQGTSKLRIAAAASGTARNLNTVRKLVEMTDA